MSQIDAGTCVWAGVLAVCVVWASPADAIVTNGTGNYTSQAGDTPFSATGRVYRVNPNTSVGEFTSSGVLVAPNIVVAAAHDTVTPTNGAFLIGGNTYDIASFQRLGGDAGASDVFDGRDTVVYTLTQPVTNVDPATLYTGDLDDLVGEVGFYTGFGDTGTGLVPPTGATGDPDETLLVGTNRIDQAGGPFTVGGSNFAAADNVLLADFDDGPGGAGNTFGSINGLATEAGLATGDSGGGLFVFNTTTSSFELVGTHSFVVGFPDFGFGQVLGSTAFNDADRATILALVPEPASLLTLALLSLGLTPRRRPSRA